MASSYSRPLHRAKVKEEILVLRFVLDGSEAQRAGDFDGARAIHQEGLLRFPRNPMLRHECAHVSLRQRRYAVALAEFRTLADESDLPPLILAFARVNMAWCHVMIRPRPLDEEADAFSLEAFEALRTTRGCGNPRSRSASPRSCNRSTPLLDTARDGASSDETVLTTAVKSPSRAQAWGISRRRERC